MMRMPANDRMCSSGMSVSNALSGRTYCGISVSPSGLWVEPEDAQFLGAPARLGETRRPRDGLVARR